MATVRNNLNHVVSLTGGTTIGPFQVLAGVDVSGLYEQALISEGDLTVMDPAGAPPAPVTRSTGVSAVIPFAHADGVVVDTTANPMTIDGKSVAGEAVCPAVIETYGHSIPTAGVPFPSEQTYPTKLGKLLGAAHLWNSAVGGSRSCVPALSGIRGGWSDIYQRLTRRTTVEDGTNQGGAPYLPQSQVFIHHQLLNDIGMLGSTNLRPAIEAHRGIWSRALAAAVDENDSTAARPAPDGTVPWTFTGTWAPTATTLTASGAGYNASTTVGDKATYRTPVDHLGVHNPVAIGLIVSPTYDYVISVKVDGVVVDGGAGIHIQGSSICDPSIPSNNTFMLRFAAGSNLGLPAIAAGSHVIEIAIVSKTVGGSFLIVDFAQIECAVGDTPIIVAPNANRPFNYGIWNSFPHGPLAGADPMNDASIVLANAQLLALVNEFNAEGQKVIYVDIDTVIAKALINFAWDQTHFNGLGQKLITAAIHAALIGSGMLSVDRLTKYIHLQKNMNWQEVGGFNAFAVAFANSWVNFTGLATLAFRLTEDGYVKWKGIVRNGTAGSGFTTSPMPKGFLPREYRYVAALSGLAGATGACAIDPAGNALFFFLNSINTLQTLDGITYPAEA